MTKSDLGTPEVLAPARTMAHGAAQLLYRAAVANVAPMPAHEHTNLGWNSEGHLFQTHPLDASGVIAQLSLSPLAIRFGDQEHALAGVPVADALAWLDDQLAQRGLTPATATTVTYDLPDEVTGLDAFDEVDGLASLSAWFDLAGMALQALAEANADLDPGPSPVRCWPHHFDIATYVSLEAGDAEEARGIGVGMSPGDGAYDQPYFYVNPWPHLDRNGLPDAVAPGHWHRDGFVGLIATGAEIMTLPDADTGTLAFLTQSFDLGRKRLFP